MTLGKHNMNRVVRDLITWYYTVKYLLVNYPFKYPYLKVEVLENNNVLMQQAVRTNDGREAENINP